MRVTSEAKRSGLSPHGLLARLLRGSTVSWGVAVTGSSVEPPLPPGGPVTGAAPTDGEAERAAPL